jgi:hypothetical protein
VGGALEHPPSIATRTIANDLPSAATNPTHPARQTYVNSERRVFHTTEGAVDGFSTGK